ncbi:ParB/RepB/Spo0J family partition protein [Sagittula sp. S175]|uniref:ParB/RepB/Spo0J family partition protein n=1 Tax=Sagittula sp. S175 TaxID=3415129 RepID=UPI003C7EC0D1
MIERLTTITELPVDQIQIVNLIRDVSPDGVENLKETIQAHGFVGRIVVRRTKKGDVVLDGQHRLTALRELGEAMIPCDVIKCSDDEALMFAVDGNVKGAGMTPLQLAYSLARRREAYQRLHPEARQGYAATAARMGQTELNSLSRAIAQERGISERQVYKIMSAGEKLGPDEYRRLSKAETEVKLADLEVLAKVTQPGERYYIIDALVKGSAKKASAARRQYQFDLGNGPAPRDATDAAHMRLSDAWTRANKAARRRFLEDLGNEVGLLLAEMQEEEVEALRAASGGADA